MRTALDHAASAAAAPIATGAEVAWALRRVGCEARLDGPEHIIILRDGVAVARLPLNATVHAATMRALLRTFALSPEQLAAYIADPSGVRKV